MNTKRQTVWLVSMLSLMVVLSAYYLFTQDKSSPNVLTDGTQSEQQAGTTEVNGKAGDNGIIVSDAGDAAKSGKGDAGKSGNADGTAANAGDAGKAGSSADKASSDEPSAADQQVIDNLTGVPSTAVFAQIQEQNQERYDDQVDSLMKQIASTSDSTAEQASQAATDLQQLEERYEKLNGLQADLQKKFDNVAIDEQNNRFKVVVQTEKLEKSEAVSIIDQVVKTLDVPADLVSVQYVP
ncbi:SpoIIIAH-like family protein [Paenibacillus protaetiae]|uniref:SpoIIIAH-like family protein n=1 Tax=Paenibacillus protaetiae TaxID=2509456 RepID=A0A4P6EWY3_9BACL|nr:SpoIIIAH-like family protein [Paenibacillus protaetiae]QAY66249.1 SpoIIIAH-like family protein [Paenibacillus protaetiae]